MSIIIEYKKFNKIINEARVPLGSEKFMIIKPIEIVEDDEKIQDLQQQEIQLKIVDNDTANVIIYNMNKEELKEVIDVLNYILTQVNSKTPFLREGLKK